MESYAAFEAVREAPTEGGGRMLCSRAKNWSHDNQRGAGFRVLFDREVPADGTGLGFQSRALPRARPA